MSKTLHYGEDCIFLDAARRKLLETAGECLKACWLLHRRIKSMYGHVLPALAYQALTEQRAKVDRLISALEDFKEYMEEERAWAPAEEKHDGPHEELTAAMAGLLDATGGTRWQMR